MENEETSGRLREMRIHASRLRFLRPLGDELLKFIFADDARNRAADFFEAGKIPEVREIAALPGLDRLDRAVVPVEKNAFAVGFFDQAQSAAIMPQARELLDEIVLGHLLECREAPDFFFGQPNLPRPAAAGRATLAFVKNRHAADYPAARRTTTFELKGQRPWQHPNLRFFRWCERVRSSRR